MVPVYSGVLKHCLGLNFGYDDGQTFHFCNCNVGIRFDSFQVFVRRLRGLCWASIVCGTLSS